MGKKPTKFTTLFFVTETPTFVTKPKSQTAIAGQEVLIECQAQGDPHPDITWSRTESDINVSKVKIIHGKGIRISDVHPMDAGTYVCTARNVAGFITAKASLKVFEPPVLSVTPEASIQTPFGSEYVTMDCLSTGRPKPIFYWVIEGLDKMLLPGDFHKNVKVGKKGSLTIKKPDVSNTGHYSCVSINEVGSAIARSHLLVYDPEDFNGENLAHSEVYHKNGSPDLKSTEARHLLEEESVKIKAAFATSSTSIKINWQIVRNKDLISGFRVWFRESDRNYFKSVDVAHSAVTSFVINRLKEFTDYEVFVQPYFKEVYGLPSESRTVQTHQDLPKKAPVIVEARLINSSTIFLAWDGLNEDDSNGLLEGYEVSKIKPFHMELTLLKILSSLTLRWFLF